MARDLDVGVPLLGQVVSAMLLVSAAIGLVAGPLADRYGHRRLILLGLVSAAICLLAFGLAPTFPVLLVGALAGGLANAAVPGPSLAVAGTYFTGAEARRALGWATACVAGSAIVGVPVLTAVATLTGWRLAFIVAGAAVIGAVWWEPPGCPGRACSRWAAAIRDALAAYRPLCAPRPDPASLRRRRTARHLLVRITADLFRRLPGPKLAASTGVVGIAYMLGGGGYFSAACSLADPRPGAAAHAARGSNVAMALLMGLAFSAILGPLGTVAMLPLAGFAGAFGWVAVTALLTADSPAGAGTTMTLHGSLFNLGAAAGGAIGGLLLAFAGYGALAIGLPIFGLGSALLAWWPGHRAGQSLAYRTGLKSTLAAESIAAAGCGPCVLGICPLQRDESFDGGAGVRRMPRRDDEVDPPSVNQRGGTL